MAAREHINDPEFEESVDGLTLVQQYIRPADGTITRVEFIGREFLYAVKVDTSNGFELALRMSAHLTKASARLRQAQNFRLISFPVSRPQKWVDCYCRK